MSRIVKVILVLNNFSFISHIAPKESAFAFKEKHKNS
jgi:hypothetical protein